MVKILSRRDFLKGSGGMVTGFLAMNAVHGCGYDASEEEALEIALIENLQRKDLTPFEEAEGYRALAERFAEGSFATIYLSPRDYHRVHMPLDGRLLATTYIPGDLFSVNAVTAEQGHRQLKKDQTVERCLAEGANDLLRGLPAPRYPPRQLDRARLAGQLLRRDLGRDRRRARARCPSRRAPHAGWRSRSCGRGADRRARGAGMGRVPPEGDGMNRAPALWAALALAVGGIAAGWVLAGLGASRWTRFVEGFLPGSP